MKFYKEKYAGAANNASAKAGGAQPKGGKKQSGGSYNKNRNNPKKNNKRPAVNAAEKPNKQAAGSKSIFSKIKSLFGRKK